MDGQPHLILQSHNGVVNLQESNHYVHAPTSRCYGIKNVRIPRCNAIQVIHEIDRNRDRLLLVMIAFFGEVRISCKAEINQYRNICVVQVGH